MLFRSENTIELTKEGQIFLAKAEKIVSELKQSLSRNRKVSGVFLLCGNMLCEINNPEMNGFSLFNRIIDEQVIFHNEIKEELIYEKKD